MWVKNHEPDVYRRTHKICNATIQKLQYLEEATAMGAVITGGVGVGVFNDCYAVERFIKIESTHTPNAQNRQQYRQMMPIFDQSYYALEDIFQALAQVEQ
jgi:xylulokinase